MTQRYQTQTAMMTLTLEEALPEGHEVVEQVIVRLTAVLTNRKWRKDETHSAENREKFSNR